MAAGDHDLTLRERGFSRIAGVDEVGRGAFAGPLVAAAVILPATDGLETLDDSKKLTSQQRLEIADQIRQVAESVSVVIVEAHDIDKRGLHRSNLWALREALLRLDPIPDHAVVDGYALEPMPFTHEALPRADHASRAVAAASIIAKVTRDNLMAELDLLYPGYGFATNVGYGTGEHRVAIDNLGLCPAHRRSFAGVGQMSLWSMA
jgi:ribonuclease HII